jgi:hypothetical protein
MYIDEDMLIRIFFSHFFFKHSPRTRESLVQQIQPILTISELIVLQLQVMNSSYVYEVAVVVSRNDVPCS